MNYNPELRLRFLSVVIILVALVFLSKLFFLQVVRGQEYSLLADRQYINSTDYFFDRGDIFFTGKDGQLIPAATLKQEFMITIDPRLINNPEAVYDELSKVVEIEREDFIKRASQKDRVYDLVASNLTMAEADKVRALNLRGIFLARNKSRFYPADNTASHVLGYMAYRDDEYAGRYGLEKKYNDILVHNPTGSFASFFAELFLGLGKNVINQDGSYGDIVLTIEPVVQQKVESELESLIEKYDAEAGGVVVMDPQTGAIISMASWPNFNPNGGVTDIALLPNPIVENVYEMGSVVKALTIAAGIDAGKITPNSTYYDPGFITLNSRVISNHDGKGRGTVTMQEVLNQSLNTGVSHIVSQMGKDSFRQYFFNFGLGESTGIDLPDEARGLIRNLNSNRDVEYATASFGQGIAVTPIEITRAFAALANGGNIVRPHVVREIDYKDGTRVKTKPQILRQVISRQTSETITNMLVNTVDEALVGGRYSMPRYSIAAKTGTAQMPDRSGRYSEDRFLHSFFGYYPAYEPRFVTFVYIVNPKGVRFASETITPTFMDIAKFLLNYYEVPPDR